MSHQIIIQGDAFEVVSGMNPASIGAVVTDGPYGVNFQNDIYDDSREHVASQLDAWIEQISRVLRNGAHAYFFVPTLEIDLWVSTVKKHLTLANILSVPTYSNGRYLKNNFCFDAQYVLFAHKGRGRRLRKVDWIKTSDAWFKDKRNPQPKAYTYRYPSFIRDLRGNIKANATRKRRHPNEKNSKLIEKWISLSTEENDTVLDMFAGSGSVMEACIRTGRRGISIDRSHTCYGLMVERAKNLRRE